MYLESISSSLRPQLLRLLEEQDRFEALFYGRLLKQFDEFKGQSRTFMIACLKEALDAENEEAITQISDNYVFSSPHVVADFRAAFLSFANDYLESPEGVQFAAAETKRAPSATPFRSLQSTIKKAGRPSWSDATPKKETFTVPRLPVYKPAGSKTEMKEEDIEEENEETVEAVNSKSRGRGRKPKRSYEGDRESDEDYYPTVKEARKKSVESRTTAVAAVTTATTAVATPVASSSHRSNDMLTPFTYKAILTQAEREIEDPKVLKLGEQLEKEQKVMWKDMPVGQLIEKFWSFNGVSDAGNMKVAVKMAFHLNVFENESEFRYVARYINLKGMHRNSSIRCIRTMHSKIMEAYNSARLASEHILSLQMRTSPKAALFASLPAKQEPKELGIPHGVLTPRLPFATPRANANSLALPVPAQTAVDLSSSVNSSPLAKSPQLQANVKLPIEKLVISTEQITEKALLNAANLIKTMLDTKLSEEATNGSNKEVAAASRNLQSSINALAKKPKDLNLKGVELVRTFERAKVDAVLEKTLRTLGCGAGSSLREAVCAVLYDDESLDKFADSLERGFLLRVVNLVAWSARETLRHTSSAYSQPASPSPSSSATLSHANTSSLSPPDNSTTNSPSELVDQSTI